MNLRALFILGMLTQHLALIPLGSIAQNIDSLLHEVERAEADTTKAKILLGVIMDMRYAGDDRLISTIRRTVRLAELAGDPRMIARANYELGSEFEYIGTYDSAFYFYDKGILISKNGKLDEELAIGYYYIGTAYRYKGDNQLSLANYDTAITIFTKIDGQRQKATCIFGQAVVLDNMGEFQLSIDKFYEALAIQEQLQDDYGMANCYNSIGILTERTGKLDEAIQLYKKGMEIFQTIDVRSQAANCMDNIGNVLNKQGRTSEALVYHDLALQERIEIDDLRGVARSLMNISDDHKALKNYDKSLETGIEALAIAQEVNDALTQAGIHYRLSHSYRLLGQFEKALEQGMLAIHTADSIDARNELMEAQLATSQAYQEQKRFEDALNMYKDYVGSKDTLVSEENLNRVSELEAKYQNSKKEEWIKLQDKENEVLQASLSSRNFQIALVAAMLLIAVVVLVGIRSRARAQKIISAKEAELNERKIKELEKEQKILFMDAMITGQEEERKRIAKDLHDGLGVLLSTVQMHFNSVQEEIRKLNELDIYGKANSLLDEACSEVRKIAHNMMPSSLTKFGLSEAIQELGKNLDRTGKVAVEVQTFGLKERMPEKIEIMLYRVIQEALNNVIKYANASKVTVDLSKEENKIHLVIEDNGSGFDVEQAMKAGGHGLNNIHSRIKYLDGNSEIRSNPGEGTIWDILVPLS